MSNDSPWHSVHEAAILRAGFGLAPGPVQCTQLALRSPEAGIEGEAWAAAPRRRRGKPAAAAATPPMPDDLTILWIQTSPVFIHTRPCLRRFEALLSHVAGWQDHIPYRWSVHGLGFSAEYVTAAQQLAREFVDLLHAAGSGTRHIMLDGLLAKHAAATVPLSAPWFVGWLLGYPVALCSADPAIRAQLSTVECTKVQLCMSTGAPLRELIFPAGVAPAGAAAATLAAIAAGSMDLSTADPLSRKWHALLCPICEQLGTQGTAQLHVVESTCMAGSAL